MKRRAFLQSLSAATAAPLAAYAEKVAYNAPAYEAPLFHLHRFSKTPIRVKSLDLLQHGKHFFVRSVSTDGVVGITKTKNIEDYVPVFVRRIAPYFIGKDIRDLETLVDGVYEKNYKMAGQGFWLPVASAEQSLFDLFGRTVNKPVAELLGGVKRREIPVYLSGSGRETTAEQEVEVYRRGVEITGAKAVKFKIGGRMSRNADAYPGRTETMVKLARKVLGDSAVLYADANGSYDAKKGVEVGRMLQDLKFGFYEEPCPWEEASWTKSVADALDMPLAFGEQDWSLPRWQWMIDNRTMDIVQPDLNYNGGFIRAARVARMAAKAGMKIVNHNTQTGPTAVNILQFASAIPNIGEYMEFPFRGKDENEPWQSPHFVIRNGTVKVPNGPGLGLEIDPKFLASAQVVKT